MPQAQNSDWYQSVKSSLTPPNWLFAPIWTVLYFLFAIVLALSWVYTKPERKPFLVALIALNLFTNAIWSFFFFYLRNPRLAFLDLITLWISIVALMIFNKKQKGIVYLLIPYLLWVTFAGLLNYLAIK